MDAETLRGLQAPLKARYAENPDTARIPARAVAKVRAGDVACDIGGWAGTTTAGLHPAAGGDGSEACSADMLMEALAACAGVTLKSVATAMGVELRGATVTADGHWDARGTLAVDKEVPVGLTDVTLTFDVDADAPAEKIQRLVQLTERFCVIYQTLAKPPALDTRLGASS